MRHLKKGKKFHRKRGERKAFIKTIASNLVVREKITTTEAKAKELKKVVDRLVTYGKKQDLAGLKLLVKKLPKRSAYKMYHEIAPRYKERKGGYTRVVKLAKRKQNDGSKMATIEFV